MRKLIIMFTLLLVINISGQKVEKTVSSRPVYSTSARVTAYCLKGSKMANGKYPKEGVVAADPRHHRLGKTIKLNNRSYVVSDTGSKIKGPTRFDIYLYSCSEAKKFGVKSMNLELL